MNTLFVNLDVNETHSKENFIKRKVKNNFILDNINKTKIIFKDFAYKLVGFNFISDTLSNNKRNNTYFLNIYYDVFFFNIKSEYLLKKFLKIKLKDIRNLNVIFSKNFENYINQKKQIIDIMNKISTDLDITYISSENNLKSLDKKYILRYITTLKKDIRKFKILIVIKSLVDLDISKLKEYIEEYKYVDILKLSDMSKCEYAKLIQIVKDINEEYGSSIEVIQKRNILEYDFYLLYAKGIKDFFISHFLINKQAGILDLTNKDDDVLSTPYRAYFKNKYYIMTMFDRVKLNVDNFSKTELGMIYKE